MEFKKDDKVILVESYFTKYHNVLGLKGVVLSTLGNHIQVCINGRSGFWNFKPIELKLDKSIQYSYGI